MGGAGKGGVAEEASMTWIWAGMLWGMAIVVGLLAFIIWVDKQL